MKDNKGITLVALVITIIVLLILAGVTIAMTISGDGLFKRAKNSVDAYSSEAKREEDAIGTGYAEQMNSFEQEYAYQKTTNVTVDDYGKLVNEYVASENDSLQWRIFYKDNDYVYLISSTTVPGLWYTPQDNTVSSIPNNPIWSKYCTIWNNNWNSSNTNQTAGAYLMTEGNWNQYKDSEGKAAFAFGAVPFEMYIESIKATQNKDWEYTWADNGYKLSGTNISSSSGKYTDIDSITSSMNNGIYMLENYAWVAGPYTANSSYIWFTNKNGNNLNGNSIGNSLNIRPMVAIPTNKFTYSIT